MKKRRFTLKTLWNSVLNPPSWVTLLTYATTLTFCALAILSLCTDEKDGAVACTIYACALLLLAYSVYMTVKLIVKLHVAIARVADKYTFTRNLRKNYEFRTIVFGATSFLANVAYTIFLASVAMYSRAFWYWVLAGYYVLLTSMRGGMLLENRKNERRFGGNPERLQKEKVKTYYSCGVMLLVLTIALGITVFLMVFEGKRISSPNSAIVILAIVTAYRLYTAIFHLVVAKKYDDLVVRSVRNINFSTALVSILTLQTAVLDRFAVGGYNDLFNGLTGVCVCLIIVYMGIYMIVKSRKALKTERIGTGENEPSE